MPQGDMPASLPVDRKGRLQRKPNAAGYRVATFAHVLIRHGAVMGGLAVICLLIPGSLTATVAVTTQLLQHPILYGTALLGLLIFFYCWSVRRSNERLRQVRWIFYLLCVSIAEELTFRLIFPSLLLTQLSWLSANIVSNLIFAALHYVTLRWKLQNCIVTFIGGMGLSQLMSHGDLTLVVMVHWLGTFLNTPRPPTIKLDS